MNTDTSAFDRLDGGDDACGAVGEYSVEPVVHAERAWRSGAPSGAAGFAAPPVNKTASGGADPARPGGSPRRMRRGGGAGDSVIIGSSLAARALREQIELYADDLSPVLIAGETGVGKELVARELHRLSARRTGPFAPLNAGAMPEGLAAAELFGHAKGAFTGAHVEREGAFLAANGGVLFIDEIGDMPVSIQAQLLRVLDDGVVRKVGATRGVKADFRLTTATNVDLRAKVAAGEFRRDLYYRINVLAVEVPPLRVRGDDIIEIAEHLIRTHLNPAFREARLTPLAADRLRAYHFPGNVRELRNIVQRAVVHAGGGRILAEHFACLESSMRAAGAPSLDLSDARALMDRLIVMKALRQTNGNVARAAALTGRTRSTFHALKKQTGVDNAAAGYDAVAARIRAILDAC